MSTIKVTPRDVLNDDGKLAAIEYYDEAGEFQIQAMWDSTDEHTPETIDHFRKWANKLVSQLEFEIGE